jgi:required for meiotic nuclear division protein 1
MGEADATEAAAPAPRNVEVNAYAIAATLSPKELATRLGRPPALRVSKVHALLCYEPSASYVVIHDFGAIVFFDVPEAERRRVLDVLTTHVKDEPRSQSVEDFTIRVEPGAVPTAKFDRLIVGELTPAVAEVVAHVIGQSVGMEYYESDVDGILAKIDAFTAQVATQGRFRGALRDLTRFIGTAMRLRNRVVTTLALLDDPAATWDDEALHGVYRGLRSSFAIEDRYVALDRKVSMIQDSLEMMVDLTRHTRSMVLEVGVFLLILFEVVLFLFK